MIGPGHGEKVRWLWKIRAQHKRKYAINELTQKEAARDGKTGGKEKSAHNYISE